MGSKKIIAVHLLNDFSGSPLVFSQALEGLQKAGHEVILHTSKNREGFLSKLKLKSVYFPYRFVANAWGRMLLFTMSQVILFFQLLKYRNEDVIIYVNTLLPFGAALAGKFMNKKVVYHLHESYIRPKQLKDFLRFIASNIADTVFYVSNYLSQVEPLKNVKSLVIYNALPDEFVKQSEGFSYHMVQQDKFCVLMICSLKTYKGVHEFISLAQRHPNHRFELVLNASELEVQQFFSDEESSLNLFIYPAQRNLHPFYQRASLVVNLTNPALCIETFGLTLLEAMCYGVPVIAPPVGGPSEFVLEGVNGYTVDVRKMNELDITIENIASDQKTCLNLSAGAKLTSQKFRSSYLQEQVNTVIRLL